jgi:hypothetical protein
MRGNIVRNPASTGALICGLAAMLLISACGEAEEEPVLAVPNETASEEVDPTLANCIEFEVLDGFATTPSNIMLFFGLQTCAGEPLLGLQKEDFVISESGNPISLFESNLTLLPRCTGFEFISVLLLDMSGSIVHSGSLPLLQDAAKGFISQLTNEFQLVSILLFDGQEDVQLLQGFTSDKETLMGAVNSLSSYEIVDKSTNLNGAVLQGLAALDDQFLLSPETVLHQQGNLVVFTDGMDQAGLIENATAAEAVTLSSHRVYSIGLGAEIEPNHLKSLGTAGAVFPNGTGDIATAFNQIGEEIVLDSQRYYVIGYCSPKRSGNHELLLEVDGFAGTMNGIFNADEFGPGCDDASIIETAKLKAEACADTSVFSGTGQFFD